MGFLASHTSGEVLSALTAEINQGKSDLRAHSHIKRTTPSQLQTQFIIYVTISTRSFKAKPY